MFLKCFSCKHLKKGSSKIGRSCAAFPNGIPLVVFSEEILHFKKLKGQKGDYIFEPLKKNEERHKKYLERVDKLLKKRNLLEQQVVQLAYESLKRFSAEKKIHLVKGIIRQDRKRKRSFLVDENGMKIKDVLFLDENGDYHLEKLDYYGDLSKKLISLLSIECFENQKTDLEFIFYSSEEYQLNFANFSPKEKIANNSIIASIRDQQYLKFLLKKGHKSISNEQLEVEIKEMLNDKKTLSGIKKFIIIKEMLEEKKYAFLREDIRKIIEKLTDTSTRFLGYTSDNIFF